MKSWADRYVLAAQEDRCAPHLSVAIEASLRPSGRSSFKTSVIDLSRGGFAAWCRDALPVGSLCWLTLPGVKGMPSEVVWWDDSFVGCAFLELLGPSIYDEIAQRYRASPDNLAV